MSIQSEINRIRNNVNAALDELEARGASVPAGANSDDLAALIASQIIPIANGGTGATTAANARTNLGITPENIGAAAEEHTHSAADITSGTLPIARGGTGATTAAAARNNLGLGNTTGALPIANGGTGATTAAQARVNLGVDISAETIQMFEEAGYPIE